MKTILNFLKRLFGFSTVPSWKECTKSSNWAGANAAQRMMNILSPHMSDATFNVRVNWMKSRGANTAHLILCNKKDGEAAGYSIYGNRISWIVDKSYTDIMTKRIKKLRKSGFSIVLWLTTDDSSDWNKELIKNPSKYLKDIRSLGWLDYASTVVLGLELGEYWNGNQVAEMANAVRANYKGKIGTHENSGKLSYAGIGDIVFYQIDPTSDQNKVAAEVKKALSTGKPVNFFESDRHENRANCETALKNGAFAVGNW